MATTLSNNYTTMFVSEVKQAYQARGFELAKAVRNKQGNNKTFQFPTFGKALAEEHIIGSNISPAAITKTPVSVSVQNWRVGDYTDIFENNQVPFDDITETAQALGQSIGRRSDQMIIDAIQATSPAKVEEGNTGLTVSKLAQAATLLDKYDVPSEDRWFLGNWKSKQSLLSEEKATSADYATIKALMRGEIDTFMGFKFIWIGERAEGGLTVASDIRRNFAFHKSSIGYAQNMGIKTDVDWIPEKASHLAQSMFAANAKVIDLVGIIEVETDETPD